MGCIHVTVKLVVVFRLSSTARVLLSSEILFDSDRGLVMTLESVAGVAIGGAMRALTDSWNWRKQRDMIHKSILGLRGWMVVLGEQEMQDKCLLSLMHTTLGSRVTLRKGTKLHGILRSVYSKRIGAIARKDWREE